MFDKLLFDRNAFDRSVSSEGITLTMLGSSQVGLRLTFLTPAKSNIRGECSFSSSIIMQQRLSENFASAGNLADVPIILRRSTATALSGKGNVSSNIIIRTPIGASLSGNGGMAVNSQVLLRQYMSGVLSGTGTFTPRIIIATAITGRFQGSGEVTVQAALNLPLSMSSQGRGDFALRRLGALNENVISLMNINLLPGDTLTIDTDLLQVLFGATEDVSSVTDDSVFFELNPGENEVAINIDSDSKLDVVAIWQNRWL